MAITLVSVVVAVLVGGIEALGLVQGRFNLSGPFWDGIASLNDNFGTIGYLIVGIFIAAWIISAVVYRANGYDRLELEVR
jgi:high-affinity nickel-transport protein